MVYPSLIPQYVVWIRVNGVLYTIYRSVVFMVLRIIYIMSSVVGLVRQAGLTETESENDSHSGQAGSGALCADRGWSPSGIERWLSYNPPYNGGKTIGYFILQ